MHRLNELAAKLSPAQLKELEDFAEFLGTRRDQPTASSVSPERPISYEGWAGCLAHIHPEMSDAEFNQMILDERVREAGVK
ncbi:MAG TPA: DUF2281 domain-containing protein [Tepidisphaeraceae bacterium]|jgi:hypothetical protein|nr:DUF2281 domain-containing protein [Tepidisphaeraceae bacterium]